MIRFMYCNEGLGEAYIIILDSLILTKGTGLSAIFSCTV